MFKQIITKSEEIEQIKSKVDEIAGILKQDHYISSEDNSLMIGRSGIALFFFYYSKLANDQSSSDLGFDIISKIFDQLSLRNIHHSLSEGLAGIGWTLEHLILNDFIEFEDEQGLADLDACLFKVMKETMKQGNYDLLHGAIGHGVYLLSGFKRTGNRHYLTSLIDELENISVTDENEEVKWLSHISSEGKIYEVNLGMAHGMASIIAFLAELHLKHINQENLLHLLKSAVRYVLKYRQDPDKYFSFFPNLVHDGTPAKSRLAWCYGDLGIAIALLKAGKALNDRNIIDLALDILIHASHRKDPENNFVWDAGLCHGTAGIAHIFNRIYQQTKIEELKDAAVYWTGQTLEMSKFKDGLAGYKSYRIPKNGSWENEAGLLEGIAGIGLSLLSLISDIQPKWDQCMLIG